MHPPSPLHRPGGGLDLGHPRWIPARADFFLPGRVLSPVFRGKLRAKLEPLARAEIPPEPDGDPHPLLRRAAAKSWVVYSKPPFAGPAQVLASLARYPQRIARSNDRLVSLHEGQLTVRWKDRAHGHASRRAPLAAEAFLRRFLRHVWPDRFGRIRYYG